MSADRIRFVSLAALLTVAPALTGPASAQVPEGAAVICTYTSPGALYEPGTPGLFIAPLGGGPLMTVTGLPPSLTTSSFGAWGQGANSVSIRSSDGAVIVSTNSGILSPTAGVVELWIFHLNGNAVVQTQQLVLGTSPTFGNSSHRVLPDGRILVTAADALGPLTGGAMAGSVLAIVDTSGPTPTVTPLPNPVVTGTGSVFGGWAIAPSGDALYLVASDQSFTSPTNAYVQRYDFATGLITLIATLPGETAYGITCDDDGTIYVSATNPSTTTHSIYSVVPGNPATVTAVPSSNTLLARGLDLDRASGRFVAGSLPAPLGPQFNALSLIDPVTGTAIVIASAPAGGWGKLPHQGFAVNNAIESYGRSSDGQNRYWFDNFPNPGGQPTVGNLGFTLTMRSDPGTALASLVGLSVGRASIPLLGIEMLFDPATAVLIPVPATSPTSFALPIPNSPSLGGAEIMAQGLHLEANLEFAASRGLSITIQ